MVNINYKFKTIEENRDEYTSTIIREDTVPEKIVESEFTLEEKEKELESNEQDLINTQERINELKTEIAEVKTALGIE